GRHDFSVGAEGRLRVWMGGEAVIDTWDAATNRTHEWSAEFESDETRSLVIEYASLPGEPWRWLGIGCRVPGPDVSIESAAAAAGAADVAVVVAGLNQDWESEGFDRPDLALPGDQNALITAVAAAQTNTVVVLTTGSSVEMPWLDEVSAVVQAWYGGQEVGHAVADVLYGVEDPGGRLPVTFPADSRQHPGLLNYPGEAGVVRYGEGIYVGYRGFDKLGLEPMFPFGHGLSYATFEISLLGGRRDEEEVVVEVRVENTADRFGSEVIQVFANEIGGVDRRLVGFEKVRLEAGEASTVELRFSADRLRSWDSDSAAWVRPDGPVTLSLWASGCATGESATLAPE
ncbi:MAG: beta-glucosidase, partial [Acidimicrobiia bacterium]|nr:beta-glucosidase [Acidimicrobiia bacterium]